MVKLGNGRTLTSWEGMELLIVLEHTSANKLFNKSLARYVGYNSSPARPTGTSGLLHTVGQGTLPLHFLCTSCSYQNDSESQDWDLSFRLGVWLYVRAVSTSDEQPCSYAGSLSQHRPRRVLIFHTIPPGGPESFNQPHFCHILCSFLS